MSQNRTYLANGLARMKMNGQDWVLGAKAAAIAAQEIVASLCNHVQEGVYPEEIERLAKRMLLKAKAKPLFPKYDFPYTVSISRHKVIAHGYPVGDPFEPGEVVRLDLGLELRGACADLATTVLIEGGPEATELFFADAWSVAQKAAQAAAKEAWAGNTAGAVWEALRKTVNGFGYAVLENLVGHGIGKTMHEGPLIAADSTSKLQEGQFLCIEPFVLLCDPPCASARAEHSFQGLIVPNMALGVHYEIMVLVGPTAGEIIGDPARRCPMSISHGDACYGQGGVECQYNEGERR